MQIENGAGNWSCILSGNYRDLIHHANPIHHYRSGIQGQYPVEDVELSLNKKTMASPGQALGYVLDVGEPNESHQQVQRCDGNQEYRKSNGR